MKLKPLLRTVALASAFLPAGLADGAIEEIIVNADFRDVKLMQIPASLSVVSSETIAARNARHFDEILNAAPNVNYAVGVSVAATFNCAGSVNAVSLGIRSIHQLV